MRSLKLMGHLLAEGPFHEIHEMHEKYLAALLSIGRLPQSVRMVQLGGEPLPAGLVDRIYEQGMAGEVIDVYGPTETIVYATCAVRGIGAPATIGRPIANTKIYLLDPWLQPVPIGVPGELYVGGDSVARGYLGDAVRTAACFLPDPFNGVPGSRMYRTGDFARYRADGNLEFIGRRDNQIKVRGIRIELGEIESVLATHPAVLQSAVVARPDAQGERQLAAYVVVDPSRSLGKDDLRRFLRRKLPDYMVPPLFIVLDRLPQLSTGKVDRRALPIAVEVAPVATKDNDDRCPRSSAEKVLLDLWRQVLGVENVGIRDSFFDLGGHSLLALRLAAALQASFRIKVPVQLVFDNPTVEEQAVEIERILLADPE